MKNLTLRESLFPSSLFLKQENNKPSSTLISQFNEWFHNNRLQYPEMECPFALFFFYIYQQHFLVLSMGMWISALTKSKIGRPKVWQKSPVLSAFVYSRGAPLVLWTTSVFLLHVFWRRIREPKIKIQRKNSTDLIWISQNFLLRYFIENSTPNLYESNEFLHCNVQFYRLIVCYLLEHTGTHWQFIILP